MSADVAVIMGSSSDWKQMREACLILDQLQISYDKAVVSAHRMPEEMLEFASQAEQKGYQVIIAGAGGAAHLPGMVASNTVLPVIGVPMKTSTLNGQDSLLSIVQMPGGIPVATMAIGTAGAKNAGILAGRILALQDASIRDRVKELMKEQKEMAQKMTADLNE
ncbi:5-(carboxyamino)imidazole ribonucleotide mutase [Ignavigranum ruoffiae]|uniref:N5-carboxyaminoimidazole ribonucleotide mutase n=2 Tax=Ignavigranum ruoffiae TaxID=89093 RepID=A0A1H8ZSA2_9LACT|nr:5-(carboxyamino)imidazole ribonucleotide mutase [Ignavigranum ruoffiae]UPQ86736.2 5-(carboxyamino)imidazole ribonucleotide mutase [Ignavigranum ruoffiae]SEP67133.1 5-(carboxyamino)imidazole ribonucleotide mutase [Ignavigranum ruoffiae]